MSEEEVTIKKSISLRQDLYKYALEESEKKHGGNFSAFLTYLISCQKNNTEYVTYNNGKEVIILTKERVEKLFMYEKWLSEILELLDDGLTIVAKGHLTMKSETLRILIDKHLVVKSMGLEKNYDISIKM
ncbi:hypothetical protein D0S48_18215 [Psychrobacillus sp. AK 1817]|uniref:hypothetical protein n=1 Tax=Psychrobacillus sp. AK 1817 TaxID=2303505 RepID=UPI001249266A|nr:hypothetical protein [Psychrobacillus sp. AK 1817]QEY22435.1 hypothetical protein D0S48_18215 [Psychrobacillus sp. AK 1817]